MFKWTSWRLLIEGKQLEENINAGPQITYYTSLTSLRRPARNNNANDLLIALAKATTFHTFINIRRARVDQIQKANNARIEFHISS